AHQGVRGVRADVDGRPRGLRHGTWCHVAPAAAHLGAGRIAVTGMDPLTRLWWIRLPRSAARLSAGVSAQLADGHFLGALPILGALATPAAALTGLAFGALRIGYFRSFSE